MIAKRLGRGVYRTPIGGRGPRLLWLLCAEGSDESRCRESPLPALALALPVRLRTILPLGGWRALTPACCSTCCGATALPWPGGYRGTGWRTPFGGDGLPPFICCPGYPFGGDGRPFGPPGAPPRIDGLYGFPGDWLDRLGKAPFIMPGGPWLYCNSSRRALVSELVLDSACIAPRSTAPYLFVLDDKSGSSIMFS